MIVGREHLDAKKSRAVARKHGERTGRGANARQRQATDANGKGRAVIICLWRAAIVPARMDEHRRFERERCMPMFRKQPGFLGVLFLQYAEYHASSLSIWEDAGAVEALRSSPSYREIARELAASGLLAGDQSVEVLEVEGGELRPEAIARALDRARNPPWRG